MAVEYVLGQNFQGADLLSYTLQQRFGLNTVGLQIFRSSDLGCERQSSTMLVQCLEQ